MILKKIRQDLTESQKILQSMRSDLLDPRIIKSPISFDHDLPSESSEFKNIYDTINSNLNILLRNITTLSKYTEEINEIGEHYKVLGSYNLKINLNENMKLNLIEDLSNFESQFNRNDIFGKILDLSTTISNKDFHIQNIYNYLERINFEIIHLKISSKEIILKYKKDIDDYHQKIKMIPVFEASRNTIENNLISYIDDKKQEIDRQMKVLDEQIESSKKIFKSLENSIVRAQQQNNSTNDNFLVINKKFTDFSEQINSLSKLNKDKISEIELQNENHLKNILKDINEKYEDQINKFTFELDDVNKEIQDEIKSIKNTSQSFKNFVSNETSIKLTNDYKDKADFEKKSYYFFNILSFLIITVAIYISYESLSNFALAHVGTNKTYNTNDLAYLTIRLIFSLIVLSSLTFTSKLASKSYIYWKKNEGIFLRLTALKSFIADMSPEKKTEIHEKLVDVYFGKDDESESINNNKIKDLPNNITQLLSKIVEHNSNLLDISKNNKVQESSNDK